MRGGERAGSAAGFEALFAFFRRMAVRAFSPDGLGALLGGFILLSTVGTPFVPPGGLIVMTLLAGVLALGEVVACLAAFLFVSARLYASGVFENQSGVPLWRYFDQELPIPLFNADGAAMFFLVLYGGWAFSVLARFQGLRERLRATGVDDGDVARLAFASTAAQILSLAVVGGCMVIFLGLVP